MTSKEIRQRYLDFFQSKGHAIIPSASLLPENDSSTLFTSSGMQPLVPYLMGEKHPEGNRLADSQKSFRAEDIEEVGDNRHNTFFEMLGNWSLGDYFKKEQIPWIFEFLIKEIGLDPNKLYVTVFRGNSEIGIDRDVEAVELWKENFKSVGIDAKDIDFAERDGMADGRIFYYPDKKNWWSRSGVPANMPVGEIGGPDSEMFYDLGAELKRHENSPWKDEPCHVNCDCGRFIEIGNSVFMEFIKTEKGFEKLAQQNVDFGGGLERLSMVSQGKDNVFETDLFSNILNKIEGLSGGKKYRENMRPFEVITDHLKAATFIMGDDKGISPSNTGAGYIVRRLIRRAVRYGRQLGITSALWTSEIVNIIINDYKDIYPELERNKEFILKQFIEEEEKFAKTLERGLKEFENIIQAHSNKENKISGVEAFNLYQTFGFPIEMTEEMALEKNLSVDKESFNAELEKHQELSRTASAGMFKGGLADSSEETKKLHTAAHLLLAALRQVLGNDIYQKGSNITSERLRFDFNYPEKLTPDQISTVENLVNQKIAEKIPVEMTEMPKAEALKLAKVSFDPSKYGDVVKVYKIGDFSIELCGGPHIENISELGHFKIQKEESSSSGVRRIKAVINS